jgi:hypothetical protein
LYTSCMLRGVFYAFLIIFCYLSKKTSECRPFCDSAIVGCLAGQGFFQTRSSWTNESIDFLFGYEARSLFFDGFHSLLQ